MTRAAVETKAASMSLQARPIQAMNHEIRKAMAVIREQLALVETELNRMPIEGNPEVLSMPLREFIFEKLIRAKRVKNLTYHWTDEQAFRSDSAIAKHCPYKKVGDMPVYYFVQHYTTEELMRHRAVGQIVVRKLSNGLADFGIKWPI